MPWAVLFISRPLGVKGERQTKQVAGGDERSGSGCGGGGSGSQLLASQRLEIAAGGLPGFPGGGGDKVAEIHLGGKKIADISALKGLHPGVVALGQTQVTNLAPLAGMPLRYLDLNDSPGITDLSPLKGAPLAELHLLRTGVRDLEPLRGMPLKRLNLEGTKVQDLGPLAGMPLEWLVLNYVSTYRSFDPLKGAS